MKSLCLGATCQPDVVSLPRPQASTILKLKIRTRSADLEVFELFSTTPATAYDFFPVD